VSGFTLIEVLATLTIFLILLGMALKPATRWHREQRIRGAVHVAQSTLRLARETAMARRERVDARFLNAQEPSGLILCRYWIETAGGGLLGLSNALPDGIVVYTNTYTSTQGEDGVIAFANANPGWGIVRHILVGSNGPALTHWALIATQQIVCAFSADGSQGQSASARIGLVESRKAQTDPVLTGAVEMVRQAGFTTTTAHSL
jgi:prepilin-type N-terminal cleavage/methylation domain-containing protein